MRKPKVVSVRVIGGSQVRGYVRMRVNGIVLTYKIVLKEWREPYAEVPAYNGESYFAIEDKDLARMTRDMALGAFLSRGVGIKKTPDML